METFQINKTKQNVCIAKHTRCINLLTKQRQHKSWFLKNIYTGISPVDKSRTFLDLELDRYDNWSFVKFEIGLPAVFIIEAPLEIAQKLAAFF